MVWLQYLIISLASITLGALLGYFLNKRGVQNERDARERIQLQSAVKGLLTELNANLELIKKGPDAALLPRLAKDMWNIHKSRIVELPSEMQAYLYEAYVRMDYVNAVPDIRADIGTRGYGPGAWDERYRDEAKRAREPIEKAREELRKWLAEQAIESRGEMTLKNKRMSKLKDKLKANSERIFLGCALFFIVNGCVLLFCQLVLGIGVISVGVAGIGVWIATKSDNRMQAMARLELHEKIAVIENYRLQVKSNTPVADRALDHDIRGALELRKWVKRRKERHPTLEHQLWESINTLKTEAKAKDTADYEGLLKILDTIEREFEKP